MVWIYFTKKQYTVLKYCWLDSFEYLFLILVKSTQPKSVND